jgi:hypothetical protein
VSPRWWGCAGRQQFFVLGEEGGVGAQATTASASSSSDCLGGYLEAYRSWRLLTQRRTCPS